MSKFDIVNSSVDETIGSRIDTINEVSELSEAMVNDYLALTEEQANKILEDFITWATNVVFSTDEDWTIKSFNAPAVYWFVVASAKTNKNVWTIRYFKNKWNVVFTANGSKQSIKLWRITSKWVQRIKAMA